MDTQEPDVAPTTAVALVGPTPTDDDALVGLATLLPQVLSDIVVDTAAGVHRAVAARTFARVPGSDPVKVAHDRVVDAVYGTLGTTAKAAETMLAGLARLASRSGVSADLPSLPMGSAILNGIIGDLLDEDGNPLAIQMAVRDGGCDLQLDEKTLFRRFPSAGGRIAVLLHGLVESDASFDTGAQARGETYDDVLRAGGFEPLRVRYNSGRRVADNGVDLANLLDRLVQEWPTEVTELMLVGHSMGGLVIRGAADVAEASGLSWLPLVDNVVMLGTPHSGAALEKAANAGAWLLGILPELAPFGTILKRRSAGIKDLRHGYVARLDWEGQDPDTVRGRRASSTGGLDGARLHNVGATVTDNPRHPMGSAFGDLLVRLSSAHASGHPWAHTATVTHLGGSTHFSLLNHPAVADLLADLAG